MAVVTPLNNPGGPEGDTVTVAEKLLNTEYYGSHRAHAGHQLVVWIALLRVPRSGLPRFSHANAAAHALCAPHIQQLPTTRLVSATV